MQGDQIEAGQLAVQASVPIAHGGVNTVSRAAEADHEGPDEGRERVWRADEASSRRFPASSSGSTSSPARRVSAGESILVLESMKMETPINSSVSGVIASIDIKQGDQVESGQLLATVRE